MKTRDELAVSASVLICQTFSAGWRAGIEHVTGCVSSGITAPSLLERFVELYGEVPLAGKMIADGNQLWRDYYLWRGDHMILTDEGWEPGEAKVSYERSAAEAGALIGDVILDEVNAPS